jgi:hypothetical protein
MSLAVAPRSVTCAASGALNAQQNLAFFCPPHSERIRIFGWRRKSDITRNLKI